MNKKFDYTSGSNLDWKQLAEYGQQGWELVSVVFVLKSIAQCSGDNYFYFKREIPQ